VRFGCVVEFVRVAVLVDELCGLEFWKFGQESHSNRGIQLWCFEVPRVHGIENRVLDMPPCR